MVSCSYNCNYGSHSKPFSRAVFANKHFPRMGIGKALVRMRNSSRPRWEFRPMAGDRRWGYDLRITYEIRAGSTMHESLRPDDRSAGADRVRGFRRRRAGVRGAGVPRAQLRTGRATDLSVVEF